MFLVGECSDFILEFDLLESLLVGVLLTYILTESIILIMYD